MQYKFYTLYHLNFKKAAGSLFAKMFYNSQFPQQRALSI